MAANWPDEKGSFFMNAGRGCERKSYIFFLPESGEILFISQPAYVALVRGEITMHEYAGRRMRVADLYVVLQENTPVEVENETYSFLYFDDAGRAHAHHGSFSLEQNRAFYRAALGSQYSDIDCDPEIRKVREGMGDEFSWLPTDREREEMHFMIFDADLNPE